MTSPAAADRDIAITFLGTSGYHPTERSQTLGVLLPDLGLAFDAGTGTQRLTRLCRGDELTVLLSHAHLDHIIGLTFLVVPVLKGILRRVRVVGLPEHLAAVRDHLFAPALFPVAPPFEFEELPERLALPDGGVVRHVRTPHPGGSVGYRIDWADRSLAYITDTTARPGAAYESLVEGVDLLLHECNFGDRQAEWAEPTGHSHLTPVLEVARRCRVGRLCLMHFDPSLPGPDPVGLAAAREIFPATELMHDLQTVWLARGQRPSGRLA